MMKKLITLSMTALAALALVFSCTKKEVVELTVSPLSVNFDVAGGEQTVAITCNDHWTVTKDADWITIGTDKGDGNGSVKITVPENKALDTREGTVTVAAGEVKRTVTVAQLGKKPVLTVSPDALNATDEGGVLELTVTSNVEWTLTIPEDAIWVSAEKKAGEGNDVVKFTVSPNEGLEARETELVFNSGNLVPVKVKLSQMGQEPFFAIDMEKVEAPYGGGDYAIKVTTNLAWTLAIPEEVEWISADVTEGEKDAVVTLTVEENIFLEGREAVVEFIGGESYSVELPVSQQAGVPSHVTDSLALAKIYAIADGANWKESRRWDFEKPIVDWPGIKLDDDGRVIECSITNGTVTTVEWEIPEELSTLTALKTLQIVGSKLKGEIPAFFYDMTTLEVVRLNTNDLTGSLSEKLGQLTNLTDLYLNGNKQFSGNIPSAIGQLKKLVSINVAQTAVGGPIPQSLTGCESLKNFMAYSAGFTGEIPNFWDQLPTIGVLQLYDNPGLEGPIPATIGTLKSATGIQLKNCNLTGNIPASFGGLEKCGNLQLNGNKLSGVVPAEVQAHPKWGATTGWKYETNILPQQEGYGLLLAYTHQTDSLALIKIYTVADGANWKESRRWDLNQPIKDWPGIKLDEDGRVIECSITNGTVSTVEWELPAEIATMDKLQTFQAVGSKVIGTFPEWLYDMTTLTKVRLNNNAITGSLSAKIGQLTELTELFLNGNKDFGGTIPAAIGSLKLLNNFNIAETAISGAVPAELSGCDALATFVAYKSGITSLPDNLDQWPALKTFMIYGNNIEGPLPESLSKSTTITSAQMYNCNFTGNIPASYGNLPSTCNQLYLNGNKLHGLIPEAVQNHPNFNVKNRWNAAERILPQQDGYTLYLELNHQTDSLALVAIYNAADGANWTKNNWDLSTPIKDWNGVTVTNDRVTALKLTVSGVIASEWNLPKEVGLLSELTDFRISSNKLTGNLPDELYDLSKLEKLYFQNDNITGSLSSKLAQLTELTELYVDRNANMTGGIPKEIGQLKKLMRINISQSGIGGAIPAELGGCDALLQFMAFKTNLSGELPDIWDMPVLQTVMLHTNPGLTGNLPSSLSKLKTMPASGGKITAPSLQLQGCCFTGNIPESFANLYEGTKQVYVQENQMDGVIPAAVQAHANFASWKYSPQQEGHALTLE